MSTDSDLSEYYENGPLGHRYMIHLKSKDEICLHALTLLQTDLLPCFLPAYLNEDEDGLIIDLKGCISVSSLKGKEKYYVKHHYKDLLTDFLQSIVRSFNYSLDPGGICCLEDQLFYNRKKQRLECIYLPLSSRLRKTALLSGIDENAFDDLLHFPYEEKWISPKAMEKLYVLFRNDDDLSALRYIGSGLWEDSRSLPSSIRFLCLIWGLFLIMYIFCSKFIENCFHGTALARFPNLLFFLCTAALFLALFMNMRDQSRDKRTVDEEKTRRRKEYNTQILFPESDDTSDPEHFLGLYPDPVQLIRVDLRSVPHPEKGRLTIWTRTCSVGSDSDCCNLPIDHPSLALCHAYFAWDDEGFYIEAVQDSKGTYLNRQKLSPHEKAYIHEGDIIGMGELEFETHFIRPRDEDHRSG